MIPSQLAPYAKAVVAVLGAVIASVIQAWPDSPDVQRWGGILTAFLTAVAVYVVPNTDPDGGGEHRPD